MSPQREAHCHYEIMTLRWSCCLGSVFVSQFIICTHSVSSLTSLGIFVSVNETAEVTKTANTLGFCPYQLDWRPLIHDIK